MKYMGRDGNEVYKKGRRNFQSIRMFRSLVVLALLGFCLCDQFADLEAKVRKALGPEIIKVVDSLNDADKAAIRKLVIEHREELKDRASFLKLLAHVSKDTQAKYSKLYAFLDKKIKDLNNKEAQDYAEFVFQSVVDIRNTFLEGKADAVEVTQKKAAEVVKQQAALSADARKAIDSQFPIFAEVIASKTFKDALNAILSKP